MNCFTWPLLVLLSYGANGQPDLSGAWEGTLRAGRSELRIVLHLWGSDGTYSGTMDSVDEAVPGLTVDEITVDGSRVRMRVSTVSGLFDGVYSKETDELQGTWNQNGRQLPLTLGRSAAPSLRRPQEPRPPFPYTSADVSFDHPADPGVRFAGTLTMPKGKGPFPGVFLVSGSGPQDRDGTIMDHKPFLVLSDYLTRRGIAVLRVDDRGVGGSTGDFAAATTATFATDAAAGFAYLCTRMDIDTEFVGLLGHSEGAASAARVADEHPDVAFVVLLATPAVPGEDILIAQSELIARANGVPKESIDTLQRVSKGLYETLRAADGAGAARDKVKAYYENLTPQEKRITGYTEASRDSLVAQVTTPWFLDFLTYDPRADLQVLRCPVYGAYGELDLQTPPGQNAGLMQVALTAAPVQDFTVEVFPGLNHLFQHAQTGAPSEYGTIEETMSPEVLERIAGWIRTRTGLE